MRIGTWFGTYFLLIWGLSGTIIWASGSPVFVNGCRDLRLSLGSPALLLRLSSSPLMSYGQDTILPG